MYIHTLHRTPTSVPGFQCAVALVVATLATADVCAQLASTQVSSSGPAVSEFGEAFDTTRDRAVLFGGATNGIVGNNIYEWDGSSWNQRFPGVRPFARSRPALAYDRARGETVIFGGSPSQNTFFDDTWTWGGLTFTNKSPATSPPQRSGAAMAYDSDRQVVVMFGGFVPSGNDTNDTWEWDGTNWSQRTSAAQPPPRGAHRMVYDPARQKVVMFGGFSTPQFATLNDTWEWDGTNWSQITTTPRPPIRCDQSMVFDEGRSRVLMFGGLTSFQQPGNVPVVLGDVWELDGNQWRSKTVSGTLPTPRAYAFAAYDTANDETVLHAGLNSSTTFSTTFTLSTPNDASMTDFGSGCSGSAGVPVLAAVPTSLPWIGDTFEVAIQGGASNSVFAIMVIGFSNQTWNGAPLPASLASVGLPGCDIWVSADDTSPVGLTAGNGIWTGSLASASPSLVGLDFYLQAGIVDTGVTRPTPASVTNALHGVVGAW